MSSSEGTIQHESYLNLVFILTLTIEADRNAEVAWWGVGCGVMCLGGKGN